MNSYCGSCKIKIDHFGKPYTHVLFDKKKQEYKSFARELDWNTQLLRIEELQLEYFVEDNVASELTRVVQQRFSLSPAIPSLPPSGLRPPACLWRRPSAYVGLRHARGFASDRALAAAFSATCGISIEKYKFR